jgi:hypothetical protein
MVFDPSQMASKIKPVVNGSMSSQEFLALLRHRISPTI